MLTNIQIDKGLLNEAKQLGDHQTEWETVNNALREYVQSRRYSFSRFFDELSACPKSGEVEKQVGPSDDLLRELRNSVTEYEEPTEPVGPETEDRYLSHP